MSAKHLRTRATIGLAASVAVLAAVGAASAAPTQSKLVVIVKPDPNVLKVDPDSGEPVKHDPYVLFALKGAKPKAQYRILVEQAPPRTPSAPCNGGLSTQGYRSFGNGHVAFPLEPVGSGKYFPFAGQEPCRGGYVMNVEELQRGSWITVRSFAFRYPSFKVSYLPLP